MALEHQLSNHLSANIALGGQSANAATLNSEGHFNAGYGRKHLEAHKAKQTEIHKLKAYAAVLKSLPLQMHDIED